jgi:hypothetical protein
MLTINKVPTLQFRRAFKGILICPGDRKNRREEVAEFVDALEDVFDGVVRDSVAS